MKQIARDVIGELLETGKQTVKQAVNVPAQIAGLANKPAANKPVAGGMPAGGMGKSDSAGSKDAGAMMAALEQAKASNKPSGGPAVPAVDPLTALIKHDNQYRQQGIDNVRQELAQIKIKRYKEIQQKIEIARKKREEEIPAYIAGKPGAPRTREEQLEMQEKQAKMAKQPQSDSVALPSGPQPRGSLFFAKQRKGSSELKMGKDG